MAKFLFLLQDNPASFANFSPQQIQNVVMEYKQWAHRMAAAGKLLAGEKLADDGGKVISKRGNAVSVMDGPFAEAKEVLGGFFMIEAADYAEAVEIARSCPHVQYGASTHVRLVEET